MAGAEASRHGQGAPDAFIAVDGHRPFQKLVEAQADRLGRGGTPGELGIPAR
jgi:hypothetical protein